MDFRVQPIVDPIMFVPKFIGVVLTLLTIALTLDATATTMTASGSFQITLTPQTDIEFESGRMTIEKTYSGDLEGKGRGQMLSTRTEVPGSASYIALETVGATLAGKTGSFTLQHSGTMVRGKSTLKVTIVTDSGTNGLKGISGSMEIEKDGNQHHYTLTYYLEDSAE